MASSNLPGLTEITDPAGTDEIYVVKDPNGTPLDRRLYLGGLNIMGGAVLVNGKISVTVASNNITVALKTLSGGNPSATDPVSIWINGTMRRCVASLSVTKNAGTNWMSLGSDLPALETDLFVYLIWNTTPATDIMDIGFARIPYGRVYSDFSTTTTTANYLAFANASTPTSTDDVVLIGRFAATLSAAASYNWSVPTFTNSNLIQHPIDTTRLLSWTPTLVGFSANPTDTIYNYRLRNRVMELYIRQATNGTSNATNFTISLPYVAKTLTNYLVTVVGGFIVNNGATANGGSGSIASAGTVLTLGIDQLGNVWNAANGKRISNISISYDIA